MNVGGLILNFRAALEALVPIAEQVGIAWRREEAYDEWDNIASTLYANLVEMPLRWSLPERERERFSLPRYDLVVQRYESTAFVEVVSPTVPGVRVFHALDTNSDSFDRCECKVVLADGSPESEELESYPLRDVSFRVRYRSADSGLIFLDELAR